MVRFLLIFCLLLAGLLVCAQEVVVKKSSDIVVIKGKSYYFHVVEEGQTLFSICKAYGVSVEEVRELNGKKDNALSLFEVLKVPYVEPYVEKDKDYYYYKVQKGETLYSISRKFDIKVRRILKENEQYENNPLPVNAVLRLPLSEIRMPINEVERITAVTTQPQAKSTDVEKTLVQQKKEEQNVPEKSVVTETKVVSETKSDIYSAPVSDSFVPDNKYVKVALLLPLYAHENMAINRNNAADSTGKAKNVHVLHKSDQFLYFYEGILLAVDSLKNSGYKIDLHVFDTDKNNGKMVQITSELNRLNPDLIIGPIYGSEFKVMAEQLENKNIPIVYPLSARNDGLDKFPNFLQVNTSSSSLTEGMANWLHKQSEVANIISINLSKGSAVDEQGVIDMTEKKLFTERLHKLPGVNFYKWNFQGEQSDALKLILKKDRENIIVLPTSKEADVSKILPVLSAFADGYKITLIGFPDWQNFTVVDHENFYKLNVKVFTYSYVDNYSEQAKAFANNYRKYFNTEPHTLTNKAYDLGLYFIPLAAKFGPQTLGALEHNGQQGVFSQFRFSKICEGCGQENKGLFIVNYGSDYKIKVLPLE